ncbi:MAG: Ribosomal RNA small subunit methyltransferase A [Phycisphaerae bacterium]|nr:Ribosomal RNA small subunit methyltransferase A [Phycisphaerae bacterium]
MKAQTKSDIRAILTAAGLQPNRRLGQCFLIDGNLLRKLVESAELGPDDVVLEVGPGTGSLTELLLEQAGAVVAVEVDRGLHAVVQERLGQDARLTLLHQDVLAGKSAVAPEVVAALQTAKQYRSTGSACDSGTARAEAHGSENNDERRSTNDDRHPAVKLVANLPYQVTTPLLIDLLVCPVEFHCFCFSVQKEVAERLMADPGSKAYGPVSIVLQCCSNIHRIADLPPSVFWPSPTVDSMLLRMDLYRDNFSGVDELAEFIRFVRAGFTHRRKTLHYHFKERFPADRVQAACAELGIDLRWRPEQMAVELWLELFFALKMCQSKEVCEG